MNDQEFKKQLQELMGNPPPAPSSEYQAIMRRVEAQKNVGWLSLKPVLPALALLLFVVLFVGPKNYGGNHQPINGSALSFYSEDTVLSTDIFTK